jgi:hypothetical protein
MERVIYSDEELIYSAGARCDCGAGLAYPKKVKENDKSHEPFVYASYWDCSDILTGRAIPKGEKGSVKHSDRFPFSFYSIKSENQPSAYGATTRQL